MVLTHGRQQRATCSLYHPSPAGLGRRMERKRQKLVGRDKGSLTEQWTKWTVITIILIRRIYKTNSEMHRVTLTAQCPTCSRATINFPPWPAPPSETQHMVLNTLSLWPVWVSWPGCVPSWLLVKVDPVLAKPRTRAYKKNTVMMVIVSMMKVLLLLCCLETETAAVLMKKKGQREMWIPIFVQNSSKVSTRYFQVLNVSLILHRSNVFFFFFPGLGVSISHFTSSGKEGTVVICCPCVHLSTSKLLWSLV